jgi:hypothetical protein
MPGYSSECVSGVHNACVERDCRCDCHPWTQALRNQPLKRSDPNGGYQRNLPPEIQALVPPPAQTQIHNTCPQCATRALVTDVFCRKDGMRLAMGKQCLGCGAPEEPEDQFCWQCGLKAGEKPPPPPEPTTYEQQVAENDRRIEEIKALARKKGLLKETVV